MMDGARNDDLILCNLLYIARLKYTYARMIRSVTKRTTGGLEKYRTHLLELVLEALTSVIYGVETKSFRTPLAPTLGFPGHRSLKDHETSSVKSPDETIHNCGSIEVRSSSRD